MASSKPTAIHFTLIFFVMLSLFLSVFAYMFYTDYQETSVKLAEAQKQTDTDKQAIANGLQQITELKDKLGYQFDAVGSDNDPNSVLGAVAAEIKSVAGLLSAPPQQQTVRETFNAVAAQLKNRAEVAQQAQAGEQASQANFQQQTDQQANAVTSAQAAQQASETLLRDEKAQMEEKLTTLNSQVTQWQADYRKASGELATLQDQYLQAEDDWNKQKKQYQNTIDYLREEISQLENISFESPDGQITLVDNVTRHVWIDQGEREYLRPQVTFSVYNKDHQGIARSTADVKAKIEVVAVEARSARCRILEEDLTRPIAPGDPIYTPLWQAGMVEKVAFVGIMDLDGDGVSDRELLQEMMDVNHSQIKLQILDDGSRVPAEAVLDVDTKFLVKGDIPDPNNFPGLDEKQRHISDMMEQLHLLEDEAKRYGVQVISMNEFLTWVGYKNQQRTFRPGDDQPYNLGAGAASQGTGGNFQDRTSSGTVSGAVDPNRPQSGGGMRARFGGNR